MDKCITIRRRSRGIELLVVIRENSYDVFIDITPEADISRKIVEKGYTLKLRFHDSRKKLKEPFHLEILNKRYKDTEVLNNSKTVIKNEEYYFEISLYPFMYVWPSKLTETKRKPKKKHNKPKISTNGIRTPGLASSKITKYSRSNINQPYSGGRCTPK